MMINKLDFAFMLLLGFGIIIFNKQFARSTMKPRMAMGIKISEDELPKSRLLSIIGGLTIIFLALFFKYINEWQFR